MKISNQQRRSFNFQRSNVKEDEVMIVCDFKENIKLGGGPNEMNQDFYHRQQCTVFGCAVIFFDPVLKKSKTVYVDYFSDVLSHDGVFVRDCISDLVSKIYKICPRLKELKKLNIWSDVGLHFRCQEVAHFLLVDLPKFFKINVEWNTFAECHGKSIVDGHFGLLSRWINDIETKQKISSIDSLIHLLNQKLINSNFKIKDVNEELFIHFFEYTQNSRPKMYKKLYIPNITHYYHFESEFNLNSGLVCLKIKMLKDSHRYQENVCSKIKVIEQKETRQTKFGSSSTETSKHKRINPEEIQYGANTSRRLQVQSQYF